MAPPESSARDTLTKAAPHEPSARDTLTIVAPHESSARDTRSRVGAGQLVILASWLGAAAFFTLVVAPAAFAVLPSRELAGSLVGRVLPIVFWSGAIAGSALLALQLYVGRFRLEPSRAALASAVVAACLIAQLWIAPQIGDLRAAMSLPLAEMAADDPQRVLFGRLHLFSVAWLGIAMLSALTLVIINLRTRDQ